MKKIIVGLALLVLGVTVFACNNVKTELSITNNLINLKVGDTKKIEYTTNSDTTPVFTVADETIVSVDKDGNVKALKIGNTEVTVKIDNVEKKATVKVISEELYNAKADAKAEVSALVASLDENDYSVANWLVIITREATALKDIDSADSVTDITSIKNTAINDINAIEKKPE